MFRHHFQNRTTIHNRPVWDGCLAAWCCALRTASKGHKKQRILKAERERANKYHSGNKMGGKKCHKMRKFFSSHPIHFMTLVRFPQCLCVKERNKLPYDYIYGIWLLKRTHEGGGIRRGKLLLKAHKNKQAKQIYHPQRARGWGPLCWLFHSTSSAV